MKIIIVLFLFAFSTNGIFGQESCIAHEYSIKYYIMTDDNIQNSPPYFLLKGECNNNIPFSLATNDLQFLDSLIKENFIRKINEYEFSDYNGQIVNIETCGKKYTYLYLRLNNLGNGHNLCQNYVPVFDGGCAFIKVCYSWSDRKLLEFNCNKLR